MGDYALAMHAPDFDCLVPNWPAPSRVKALCSTRSGGISGGPYAGLNLGLHVGDDPANVADNRLRLQSALGVRPVFMNQVHGNVVLSVNMKSPDGVVADGARTVDAGIACTVMVADCLPVLLCDRQGRSVAAAHAGWRGLLGQEGRGILEATIGAMPSDTDGLMAWLGPCIGPQAFEVGDEVRHAFVAQFPQSAACFTPYTGGKWLADLPGLARQRLAAAGVDQVFGNDGSAPWCTVANASRFFSHRRDGVSGRMAACIWLAS
jgi:YfiH family protein